LVMNLSIAVTVGSLILGALRREQR
jgi:hypothetical protein